MTESIEIPAWMGDVDPSQIGFPLPIDKSRYQKTVAVEFKQTDVGSLHLDVYSPVDVERPPLVVMIHGGAWMRGGRFEMGLTKWAGYLASAGMAVVSIDYRLAPHTTYPDSFQDCLDAVDWAVDHAEELGFDATRIGVWGDSAGGHLALLLACSQTHPSFPGPRMRASRTALKAVVAFYPPTDLERLYASEQRAGILEASVVRAFVGRRPEEDTARWREASPIEHVHENLPPIFLLQGTHDMLVPKSQAIRFAERLVQVGAEHRLEIIEDGVHGFDRIAPSPQTVELIEETRRFLTERLAAG